MTSIGPSPLLQQPLFRHTLANGLRVLLAPDPTVPAVGIAVHYNVGMRSEPPGRTGFAHLFEHLMYQGTENVPKAEYFSAIEGCGGVFNGSTHLDYTQYHQILPSGALERGLFLEADRMRAPLLDAESLRLQVRVVKEEIRTNVKNKPYGGFPWLQLQQALFRTFPNSHDGYGSFDDLASATTEDARQFFWEHYAPSNALICVTGSFDVDTARRLIHLYFDKVAYREAPAQPSYREDPLADGRRLVHQDLHAPLPALAMGWRVPDPVRDLDSYLRYVVLASLASNGGSSRFERELVQERKLCGDQSCYLGLLGDPFDVRDPTCLVFRARHGRDVRSDAVLRAVIDVVAGLAAYGPTPEELSRTLMRMRMRILRQVGTIAGRTHALAALELQHGSAELLTVLPSRLSAVTSEEIRTAAGTLAEAPAAVVELKPATRRAGGNA